jgi:predicted ATPase/DNA-binding SARP family transcriptional activator
MIERERSVRAELLKLHLLGGFRAAIGEHTITAGSFRLAKSRNLVKLLALARGQSLHREQLMEYLWPDTDLSQAANNLSQTLFAARRVLAPGGRDPLQFLVYRRDAICLTAAEPAWVDVEAFETAAAQALLSPSIESHEGALALYGGELLPEDRYEDWVIRRREALHQDYLRLSLELSRFYQANRRFDQSIGVLRQALSSEPANEEINVEMMRLYAMTGQRLQALRQYQALQNVLRRELDVEPDLESARLYEMIHSGQYPDTDMQRIAGSVEAGQPLLRSIPLTLTPFLGREAELFEVQRVLEDPLTRLISIIAPGGMGKTRLALQVAGQIAGQHSQQGQTQFRDGICFVSLAQVTEMDALILRIADCVGLSSFTPQANLREQLLQYLEPRTLLLILDNFEQLINAQNIGLLLEILAQAPGVKLLVTSRARLNMLGEQVYPLLGLDWPDGVGGVDDPTRSYTSITLFETTARRAHPDFRLDERTLPAVREICRLVEGMPLAIELSAAWCGVMEPKHVLAGIHSSLNFLSVDTLDLPERQRSLRAVFDASWNLLSETERSAVQRLSVFREGFTSEAAAQVGEIQVKTLLGLVNKCWITRSGENRLRMHEMIRQYAYQRLLEAGEEQNMHARHLACFSSLAQEAYDCMWGNDQGEWLRRLELENGNFDAAIEWGCSQHSKTEIEQVLALIGSIYPWMAYLSKFAQGLFWAEKALSAVDHLPSPGVISQAVLGKALLPAGAFSHFLGYQQKSEAYIRQAMLACRQVENPYVLAHALLHEGAIAWVHEDIRTAFLEGLKIARHLPSGWVAVLLLTNLAELEMVEGNLEESNRLTSEAVEISRRQGDRLSESFAMTGLAFVLFEMGRLSEAAVMCRDCLALLRSVGNLRHEGLLLALEARIALREDRLEECWSLFYESLKAFWRVGAMWDVISRIEEMALITRDASRAVIMISVCAKTRARLGQQVAELMIIERQQALERQLEPSVYEQAWEEGQRTSIEDLVAKLPVVMG